MDMQSEVRTISSPQAADELAVLFETEGMLERCGPAGQAAGILLRGLLLYAGENMVESMRIEDSLRQLLLLGNRPEGLRCLDRIFDSAARVNRDSSAAYVYRFFRLGAETTRRNALVNVGAMFLRLTGITAPTLEEPACALPDQSMLSEMVTGDVREELRASDKEGEAS